jgi:hypothetical protein
MSFVSGPVTCADAGSRVWAPGAAFALTGLHPSDRSPDAIIKVSH